MTDTSEMPEGHGSLPPCSCRDLAEQLPSYSAGLLPEAMSRVLEAHAAHCAACERLLDGTFDHTVRATVASALANHVEFDSELAVRLRRTVLDRTAPTRPVARVARVWPLAAGVLLAASLMLLMRTKSGARENGSLDTAVNGVDSTWASFSGTSTAPMRSALQLARNEAAPEFAALDTAVREIDRALTTAPGDETLREFRDVLESRRRELELRVARVTE